MASLERKEREEECDLDLDEIRFFFPMSALQFLVQISKTGSPSYQMAGPPQIFFVSNVKECKSGCKRFYDFFNQNIFLLVQCFFNEKR